MRLRAEGLIGDGDDLLDRFGIQPDCTTRRCAHEHRRRIGFQKLAPILMKLGDSAEGAHAPTGSVIDNVVLQDIPKVSHAGILDR